MQIRKDDLVKRGPVARSVQSASAEERQLAFTWVAGVVAGQALLIVDAGVGEALLDLLEKSDAGGVVFNDPLHRHPVSLAGRGLA